MALNNEQIEHLEYWWKNKDKPWQDRSKSRRWLKKQRNRKIRRTNKEEKPNIGYNGWEY